MVVLNPTVTWGPRLLIPTSILSSNHHSLSITRWRTTQHSYKFKIPNSDLPFLSNSPFSHARKVRISARFSRTGNRRNSLREKLTQHHTNQPRQLNEVSSDPPTDYDNTKTNSSKIDKDKVDESMYDSNYRASEGINVLRLESCGESDLRNELESWADQYKGNSEFWGIGFNPIFTVFQNKEGKIERVVVNEDEILERNGIDLSAYGRSSNDVDFDKVNSKISHAKFLATEMESGNYEIPKGSSLAKVVALGEKPSYIQSVQGFSIPSNFPMKKLSTIGIVGLCGFFVIWTIRALFLSGEDKEEYTRLEKEMLRRKIKARKEKEKLVKGSVEVIHDPLDAKMANTDRPRLDKEELLSGISYAKSIDGKLEVEKSSNIRAAKSNEFDVQVMEIRAMARHAREIEKRNSSSRDSAERVGFNSDDLSDKVEGKRISDLTNGLSDSNFARKTNSEILVPFFSNDFKGEVATTDVEALVSNSDARTSDSTKMNVDGGENIIRNVTNPEESDKEDPIEDTKTESTANISRTIEVNDSFDALNGQAVKAMRGFGRKPRVITSVKEAKEFLTQRSEKSKPVEEHQGKIMPKGGVNISNQGEKATNVNTKQSLEKGNKVIDKTISGESNIGSETILSGNNKNWMEKNFQSLEPVIKKIGGGFRENYVVAREKIKQELDTSPSMNFPEFNEDDGELDWMKDDRLREIVFQVRDNELSGRDPFHLIDEKDKLAFIKGLEDKVEKENEKLCKLHEYLHSNIENLDYGADGISVYDPPEKVIPRWKGPPINQNQNQNPEFLENFVAQRKALVKGNSYPDIEREDGQNSADKIKESPLNEKILPKSNSNNQNKKSPKTVIEGSDGSFRAGKKSGKEFWEHTKKWSQGFLESYNAETDPEIKAVMKDVGKDLDRWITPKEIQEAADLMDALPAKKKDFIEKKLNKVKREMELFGPQAVLSKYREYGDQKEEDYLWWLDLPFVLCIELYTIENGEERIGLYSLEMAEDLELDPKPIHVIAFEDPGDCKNLCYIIQAHMEMLGNGNAFVVARPPKDAFREAKANGFSVTVIRKGELQLNVDQTLEEVEEQITEIGTKIYHDKIMGEQAVDISGIMKGVFGASKPSKRRRSRQKLRKPTK